MNFQEIKALLQEKLYSKRNFQELSGWKDMEQHWGPVKRVLQEGGEGEGSNFSTVMFFVDHNIHIRLDGYYSSYDGVDYHGYEYYEVTPAQKIITVYE